MKLKHVRNLIRFFDVAPYVKNPLDGEVIETVRGRTPPQYNKSTLGFRLDTPAELDIGQIRKDVDKNKTENFFKFVIVLSDILHSYANKRHLDPHDWRRTIRINTMAIKATQFDLTKKDQDDLRAEGKKAAEAYLRTYNKDRLDFVPND